MLLHVGGSAQPLRFQEIGPIGILDIATGSLLKNALYERGSFGKSIKIEMNVAGKYKERNAVWFGIFWSRDSDVQIGETKTAAAEKY